MAPVRASLALMAAVLRWRGRRQARSLEAGRTTDLTCWLRGDAAPYPAALHGGRLVAQRGERVRFLSSTAPARDITLPAGGLQPVTARPLAATDRLRTAFPAWRRQFEVLSCRDATGVRIEVVVLLAIAVGAGIQAATWWEAKRITASSPRSPRRRPVRVRCTSSTGRIRGRQNGAARR